MSRRRNIRTQRRLKERMRDAMTMPAKAQKGRRR